MWHFYPTVALVGGLCGALGAVFLLFVPVRGLLPPRIPGPWFAEVVLAMGVVLLAALSRTMNMIRSTVYERVEGGRRISYRIRRRPEVVRRLCLYCLVFLFVCGLCLFAAEVGVEYYRASLQGRPFSPYDVLRHPPRLGDDVKAFLCASAMLVLSMVLGEAVVRLVQKQGYPAQHAVFFSSLVLGFYVVLRLFS